MIHPPAKGDLMPFRYLFDTYGSLLADPFNPFPNKPCFLRVCNISLLKTLGKGEIARNEKLSTISAKVKLLSAYSFSFKESKVCLFGKR